MASLVGQKVDTRVFIEGHLIPHQSLGLGLYDGQTSQCSIVVTPTEPVKRISPYSTVTIFYYDNNMRKWCLLWEGVYVGWSFSKSPMSRSITLSCMDWTVLWQRVFSFMLSDNPEGGANLPYQLYTLGINNPTKFNNTDISSIDSGVLGKLSELSGFQYMPRDIMGFNKILQTYYFKTDVTKQSLSEFISILSKLMMWINPLIYYRADKSKFFNKFASIKDDHLKDLYTTEMFQSLITGIFQNSFNGKSTLGDLIAKIQSQFYYTRNNLCAPPFVDKVSTRENIILFGTQDTNMNQFMFQPKAFFNIPPTCNVIFPEFNSMTNYSLNYLEEATRMLLLSPVSPTNQTAVRLAFYYSDKGIYRDASDLVKQFGNMTQNLYMAGLSNSEFEQYINPTEMDDGSEFYQALLQTAKGVNAAADKQAPYANAQMGALSQYLFLEKKYGNRPLTISGCFNPYFVMGYPAVVLGEECSFMARPLSVYHSIDAQGSATTQYMMNYAVDLTPEDLVKETDNFKHTKFPMLPAWLPSGYNPENINKSYNTLLGCDALEGFGKSGLGEYEETVILKTPTISKDCGLTQLRINMAILLNSLYSIDRRSPAGSYDKSTDKIAFATNYVSRPVCTFNQYQSFYQNGPNLNDESVLDVTKMGKCNLFAHMTSFKNTESSIDIMLDVQRVGLKVSSAKLDIPGSPETQAKTFNAGYPKYDKMDTLQPDIVKTAFKG